MAGRRFRCAWGQSIALVKEDDGGCYHLGDVIDFSRLETAP